MNHLMSSRAVRRDAQQPPLNRSMGALILIPRGTHAIKHNGVSPRIDPTVWVASNAVVCGNVTVGPGCRVMFGAQVIAESGSIAIGRECIIMENAVLRSTARHSLSIGNNCLIGPNAHIVGCTVEDEVFIATGAAVFHAARLGRGSEVRVNGVVHLKTHLPAGGNGAHRLGRSGESGSIATAERA